MLGERFLGWVIGVCDFLIYGWQDISDLGISIINFLVPTSLGSCACGLKIAFPTQGLGLGFCRTTQDIHQIAMYIPSGGTKICHSIVLTINCLNLLFGTWEDQED